MTATPIPRTLALTIFGDLDLTLLDEMPSGRKPIITEIVPKEKREATYETIKGELDTGRQAYVICPRIDEPDETKANALQTKSVKAEARRLQEKVFTDYSVAVLHGKMRPKEKDVVMEAFASGEVDVLVATSVVEVGVNVPNATVIVIEGPERFGLAQLHQLRGRVLRSTHQAYCYLFPDTTSKISIARLKALAEKDLEFRGAGELYGRKQWGISDIGMEAIKNIKMVEAARGEAQKLIAQDPELTRHPLLSEKVAARGDIHFE
jgi:ATP-dependent DNA helicase RecG